MVTKKDKAIIRELALQYKQLAEDPKCLERSKRIRKTNALEPVRPIVWIEELPWHELNIDGALDLHCEKPFAREMEQFFRRTLLKWEYFQADMVVENAYYIQKSCDISGTGAAVSEETVAIDSANHIISHHYNDVLDTEEKLYALKPPVVTANPDTDRKNVEAAEELLDGILPVRLRGHLIYHAPWDVISRLRGVEPILTDLTDRPEFMHKTISLFTDFNISKWKQMEAAGLMESNLYDVHCTPAYCDELPEGDEVHGSKLKDVWFRGTAQLFGSISPRMHEEFDLQYMKRAMELCRLVYYGCCEALDTRIDLMKKIPNMRKIGVSTWSDIHSSAEQTAGGYVLSQKPNPAFVTGLADMQVISTETSKTAEACLKYRCPYDIVLKDISTISYNINNLITWNKAVQETLDKYY